MTIIFPFPSPVNFLDPQSTSDGKPYKPWKFTELVRERYFISKNINTSYNDVGKISPKERDILTHIILDEIKQANEKIKQIKEGKNLNT